jgi:hypothetical protein
MDSNGTDAYVTLGDIAEQLRMDRSHANRWVKKQGVTFSRVRGVQGQLVNALTRDQADEILALRATQGFLDRGTSAVSSLGVGCFYLVQVAPDLDPLRVKGGYASSLEQRMSAHRTIAPTLVLVKAWPCRELWERAALAVIENAASGRLGPEVFTVEDVCETVERLDAFFGLLGAA